MVLGRKERRESADGGGLDSPPAADARASDDRGFRMAEEASAGRLLVLFTLGAVTLLLAAGGIVIYLAYDRQSYVVEQLEQENEQIRGEHAAIGQQFAQQSRDIREAIRRAQSAYARGFNAGTTSRRLPGRLRALRAFSRRGLLIPRAVPLSLRSKPARLRRLADGYSVRWAGRPVLFARTRQPLRDWTRRAWPGGRTGLGVGGRRVLRLVRPSGIVYAWRERGATSPGWAFPKTDAAARRLITALR